MSEQQIIDPFDIGNLVDAAVLLHDQGVVVRPASDTKDTVLQVAAVEQGGLKPAEPSN